MGGVGGGGGGGRGHDRGGGGYGVEIHIVGWEKLVLSKLLKWLVMRTS